MSKKTDTKNRDEENKSREELFEQLVYETSYDGLNKTHNTYEVKGGQSYEITTGNAMLGHRQRVNRTVKVTEDLKIEVTVYNWDLEEDMLTKEFETIEQFLFWDVDTPHTDFIEPLVCEEYEGEMPVYNDIDENVKAQLTRKAQKISGGQAVKVSCMVNYLVGKYAVGHNPYREKTPDRDDEVKFKLGNPHDARFIGAVIPCVSVYDKATVEVWNDGVDVTFEY